MSHSSICAPGVGTTCAGGGPTPAATPRTCGIAGWPMSDDEPRFTLEVNEDLRPGEKAEIQSVIRHLLDGGAVVYLDSFAAEEDEERLREFVDEELRGDADE